MKSNLVETIKQRGYWRVNFQPTIVAVKLPNLAECKNIVEKNAVSLRGWQYPFFPDSTNEKYGLDTANLYYQGWIDVGMHKEFWRMFQSGQFLHYAALREDWFQEDSWSGDLAQRVKPMTCLGVTGSTVYQLTEIFLFLSRLAQHGLYDEGVNVAITLANVRGRHLWLEDPMRIGFSVEYRTDAENIKFQNSYNKTDVIERPDDLALEATRFVFDRFGWHNPPIDTLKQDQTNLIQKRF